MARSLARDSEISPTADEIDDFYRSLQPHVAKMGRVAARLAGLDNRDDVVQDALLQAWRSRSQYDPARGTLAAWLLAITAHQAVKVRRKLGRRPAGASAHLSAGVEELIDLGAAVKRLTRRERLAVDCYYFADLTIAETSAVMGCSEGTVKSTLSSARSRLRGLLDGG